MTIAINMMRAGTAAGQFYGTRQDGLLGQALWLVSYSIGCRVIDWYLAWKQ